MSAIGPATSARLHRATRLKRKLPESICPTEVLTYLYRRLEPGFGAVIQLRLIAPSGIVAALRPWRRRRPTTRVPELNPVLLNRFRGVSRFRTSARPQSYWGIKVSNARECRSWTNPAISSIAWLVSTASGQLVMKECGIAAYSRR